jgi:FixJ family two-component response regulator
MTAPATVFLVDDDPGVLKALTRLLLVSGYEVRAHASPDEFLERHDPSAPGCVVLDVAMPPWNGLDVQARLAASGVERPVVFITGNGDVPTSVRAMKAGAVDFLIKPFDAEDFLTAVRAAVGRDASSRERRCERDSIEGRLATLTARERQVLEHVVAGRLNKRIALDLGTVEKTIKVHRGRVMQKMGAASVADLVRMADAAGVQPAHL